jgi:hypothetical protein
MLIGIVLVHNKTTAQNKSQITTLANNITSFVDADSGRVMYTINGVSISHSCLVYQALPLGVGAPTNMYSISSHKVLYAADQPSHARRLFNWGIKRATDHGCDVVVVIKDISLMTISDLQAAAQELNQTKVLVERNWGYLIGPKLLRVVGQLNESIVLLSDAVQDLKNRIAAAGLVSG